MPYYVLRYFEGACSAASETWTPYHKGMYLVAEKVARDLSGVCIYIHVYIQSDHNERLALSSETKLTQQLCIQSGVAGPHTTAPL